MKQLLRRTFLLGAFFGCSLWAQAQETTVSGTVKDFNGSGLPGVNVIIKGTSTGVTSDIDGKFKINTEMGAVLVFSSIGYVPEEVTVNATQIDMVLMEDITSLQEVVVTGLASSIKRSNLANAVSTVSASELTGSTSPQTLDAALNGKLAGVSINANSGAPGGGISMKLRGITTVTGTSEPLYIIDGVYLDNSSISSGVNLATAASRGSGVSSSQDNAANRVADINPDDIENIEVLKGPSAAAIYGARANAGVVIITTKKGKAGKTKVSFSQDLGTATILNPLGPRTFTAARVQNAIDLELFAPGELAAFQAAQSSGKLVDWEDEIYGETGILRNSQLSLSGGNDKTQFFLSAGLQDESGIIKNTGFARNNIRANIDHKISNMFKLSVNTNFINSSADRGVTNNDNAGVSYGVSLTSTLPWDNLFADANGNYPSNPHGTNFLATRDLSTVNDETNRFIGGFSLDINLYQGDKTQLKGIIRGGLDYYNTATTLHFPEILQWQISGPTATQGLYAKGNNTVFNTNSSALLLLNTEIGGVQLTTQAGATNYQVDQTRTNTIVTQLIGGQANLEQGLSLQVYNRGLNTQDIGYFLQQEGNWQDKIIGTLGIRMDKSSLIGDPNKLYYFPKASLAANVANFDFWSVQQVNALKLRVAYGQSGGMPSADGISLIQPKFTGFGAANIDDQAGIVISNTLGNRDIQPERSKELEFGVDLGAFNDKVTLEATYYKKDVEDLILRAQTPSSSGFTNKLINGGALQNKGIELGLGFTPVQTSNITWTNKINWWRNRSEITELDVPTFTTGGFASSLGIFQIEKGKSPTQIVGTVPDQGTIALGEAQADFQSSWYTSVTFLKNFEFSWLWHWKKGGDNINLTILLSDLGQTTFDYDEDDDGDGVVNGDQRINGLFAGDARPWIMDASYIKLREVALYYSLPSTMVNNVFKGNVERLRVGVSGNNLLLFSDYKGYDPEVSNFGSNGISTGVDVTPFPSSRRMFFHLTIDF